MTAWYRLLAVVVGLSGLACSSMHISDGKEIPAKPQVPISTTSNIADQSLEILPLERSNIPLTYSIEFVPGQEIPGPVIDDNVSLPGLFHIQHDEGNATIWYH